LLGAKELAMVAAPATGVAALSEIHRLDADVRASASSVMAGTDIYQAALSTVRTRSLFRQFQSRPGAIGVS
jgi:hypothetical protein